MNAEYFSGLPAKHDFPSGRQFEGKLLAND